MHVCRSNRAARGRVAWIMQDQPVCRVVFAGCLMTARQHRIALVDALVGGRSESFLCLLGATSGKQVQLFEKIGAVAHLGKDENSLDIARVSGPAGRLGMEPFVDNKGQPTVAGDLVDGTKATLVPAV
jgi:hypothetical protein